MGHRRAILATTVVSYASGLAVLTLTPQRTWDGPVGGVRSVLADLHHRGVGGSVGFIEVQHLANILVFVPVGMFLATVLAGRPVWAALGCLAVSLGIETAQRGIPGRISGERDLLTNTIGGTLGVLLVLAAGLWARHAGRAPVPRLGVPLVAVPALPRDRLRPHLWVRRAQWGDVPPAPLPQSPDRRLSRLRRLADPHPATDRS